LFDLPLLESESSSSHTAKLTKLQKASKTINTPEVARRPSEIIFSRSRIFRAQPALNRKGGLLLGLRNTRMLM
jgi:hypothetical protein